MSLPSEPARGMRPVRVHSGLAAHAIVALGRRITAPIHRRIAHNGAATIALRRRRGIGSRRAVVLLHNACLAEAALKPSMPRTMDGTQGPTTLRQPGEHTTARTTTTTLQARLHAASILRSATVPHRMCLSIQKRRLARFTLRLKIQTAGARPCQANAGHSSSTGCGFACVFAIIVSRCAVWSEALLSIPQAQAVAKHGSSLEEYVREKNGLEQPSKFRFIFGAGELGLPEHEEIIADAERDFFYERVVRCIRAVLQVQCPTRRVCANHCCIECTSLTSCRESSLSIFGGSKPLMH